MGIALLEKAASSRRFFLSHMLTMCKKKVACSILILSYSCSYSMLCSRLSPVLIYSCDLLHRRGNLWGSAILCSMIETCCEAVSVSICHFVTWLLNFILGILSSMLHLSVRFQLFSQLFFPPLSLSSLPPVCFWAKSATIHHLNCPTVMNFQPHDVFTT